MRRRALALKVRFLPVTHTSQGLCMRPPPSYISLSLSLSRSRPLPVVFLSPSSLFVLSAAFFFFSVGFGPTDRRRLQGCCFCSECFIQFVDDDVDRPCFWPFAKPRPHRQCLIHACSSFKIPRLHLRKGLVCTYFGPRGTGLLEGREATISNAAMQLYKERNDNSRFTPLGGE